MSQLGQRTRPPQRPISLSMGDWFVEGRAWSLAVMQKWPAAVCQIPEKPAAGQAGTNTGVATVAPGGSPSRPAGSNPDGSGVALVLGTYMGVWGLQGPQQA